MDRAVSFLDALPWEGRKLAVLGGMRELGGESAAAHARLGEGLRGTGLDAVFLFGEEMRPAWDALQGAAAAARASWSTDLEVLEKELLAAVRTGDVVLLKGSRGLELERLLPGLSRAGADSARRPKREDG
jgi:UDP-N-acetylmuramoyl-tripeptide--D-alanyl-D-alanine ligase